MNYILVYNEKNSTQYIQDKKRYLEDTEITDSYYLNAITSNLASFAKSNLDIFDLKNKFEHMYFKSVYTYNKEQFDKEFVPKNLL